MARSEMRPLRKKGFPCSENTQAGAQPTLDTPQDAVPDDAHIRANTPELIELERYLDLSMRSSVVQRLFEAACTMPPTNPSFDASRLEAVLHASRQIDTLLVERDSIIQEAVHMIKSSTSTILKVAILLMILLLLSDLSGQPKKVSYVDDILPSLVLEAVDLGSYGDAYGLQRALLYRQEAQSNLDLAEVATCRGISLELLNRVSGIVTSQFNPQFPPDRYSTFCPDFEIVDLKGPRQWPGETTFDPSVSDAFGRSVLHYALDRGFLQDSSADTNCKSMLRSMNVNQQDVLGRTPLHIACLNGQHKVAASLLMASAEPHLRDANGKTPIDYAMTLGPAHAVRVLLAGSIECTLRVDDPARPKPLDGAMQGGRSLVLESIVNGRGYHPACWEVEGHDRPEGCSAIYIAALTGNKRLADWILNNSTYALNVTSVSGRTPLSIAAERGHLEVFKLLARKMPHTTDNSGRAPLSWAAGNGHEAIVRLLLKMKFVEVDKKDTMGQTPLFYAVTGDHRSVAKLLIETGQVDIWSRDNRGETPMSKAVGNWLERYVLSEQANSTLAPVQTPRLIKTISETPSLNHDRTKSRHIQVLPQSIQALPQSVQVLPQSVQARPEHVQPQPEHGSPPEEAMFPMFE